MIHESGQWSDVHEKWFFMPRRASSLKYDETEDEHKGINWLFTAEKQKLFVFVVKFREIGVIRGDGFRAFSAFQFLPNTDDDVIVALKSEERNGMGVASYLFVYRLSDNKVLLDDEKIAPYKFEGLVLPDHLLTESSPYDGRGWLKQYFMSIPGSPGEYELNIVFHEDIFTPSEPGLSLQQLFQFPSLHQQQLSNHQPQFPHLQMMPKGMAQPLPVQQQQKMPQMQQHSQIGGGDQHQQQQQKNNSSNRTAIQQRLIRRMQSER
ncbi:Soluble calcium-activated nucleotidase 1 [Globodera pallida]|nr:Soluble calcium-activated nucleotidase 1 [Globodera pallida]